MGGGRSCHFVHEFAIEKSYIWQESMRAGKSTMFRAYIHMVYVHEGKTQRALARRLSQAVCTIARGACLIGRKESNMKRGK